MFRRRTKVDAFVISLFQKKEGTLSYSKPATVKQIPKNLHVQNANTQAATDCGRWGMGDTDAYFHEAIHKDHRQFLRFASKAWPLITWCCCSTCRSPPAPSPNVSKKH